jgi:hypothetical protein
VIALALGVFAVTTEFTLAAADARSDGDPIAGFEPRDVLADCLDDAGGVAAGDMGHLQIDTGEPAAGVDVQVVQRGGFDVDDDLVSIGLGIGEVAVLQHVALAVFFELNCLHTTMLDGPAQNTGGERSTAGL